MQGPGRLSAVSFKKIIDKPESEFMNWAEVGLRRSCLQTDHISRADADLQLLFQVDDFTIVNSDSKSPRVIECSGTSAKGEMKHTIVFSPDQGGNPVRFCSKNKVSSSETTTDYQFVDGIWYPKSMKQINTYQGTKNIDEHLEFETVELNLDIPDSLFTLAGMELVEGTPVNRNRSHLGRDE